MTKRPLSVRFAWLLLAAGAATLGVAIYLDRPAEETPVPSGLFLTADFDLVNENGAAMTQADFRNKPTAWFLGFSACAATCSTQLANMNVNLDELGEDGAGLNVVFVTVDPERDTAEVIRSYLARFDPAIIGLTGAVGEIRELIEGYSLYAERIQLGSDDYTYRHTAGVVLTSARGEWLGTLDSHEPRESQLQKLRMAIAADNL